MMCCTGIAYYACIIVIVAEFELKVVISSQGIASCTSEPRLRQDLWQGMIKVQLQLTNEGDSGNYQWQTVAGCYDRSSKYRMTFH
jgi:hypothetical protein